MRHYVLTRSIYGPSWANEANARRLAITRGITVASLAEQTVRDWTWLVAMAKGDPLRAERRATFEASGVPVVFIELDPPELSPSDTAFWAYGQQWPVGPRDDTLLMTRLDDDDAFTPDAFERLRRLVSPRRPPSRRVALMFPRGFRVLGDGYTPVMHHSNAMHTLMTPPGDQLHVYAYGHRRVRYMMHVISVDLEPAWLWVRHPDSISGWKEVEQPLTPAIRSMFPIDWSLLRDDWRPAPKRGRRFR